MWHTDGYDKLKPFGFCIHSCIDAGIQPAYYLVGSWGYQKRARRHGGILAWTRFVLLVVYHEFCVPTMVQKIFTLQCFSDFFRRKAVDAFAEEKSFRSQSRHSEINYAEVAWVFKDLRDNCSAKTTFPHRSYTILFYVYYT